MRFSEGWEPKGDSPGSLAACHGLPAIGTNVYCTPKAGSAHIWKASHFPKTSVAFPIVPAAGEGSKVLVEVMDVLCAELGYLGGEADCSGPGSTLSGGGSAAAGPLAPEDEALVGTMRRGLARVAAAAGAAKPESAPMRGVCAALDGAELVIRGELVSGNAERLPSLMPSFVFLVTLPIVEQDEALELSRRTSQLIEQELGK
jgi:hypothetical protein